MECGSHTDLGGIWEMANNKRTTSRRSLVTRLKRSWGFNKLNALDRQLLEMILAQPSVSKTHLASIVNRTRQNVAKRIRRPAFKNALREGQLDALELAETYRRKAIERLAQLMDHGETDQVRLRAALFFAAPVQPARGPTDLAMDFEKFLIEAAEKYLSEHDTEGLDLSFEALVVVRTRAGEKIERYTNAFAVE